MATFRLICRSTSSRPDADPINVSCVVPDGVIVSLLNDPDPSPDPTCPRIEMIITVTQEFKDANPSVTIPCTVRDSYGAQGSANFFIELN